MRRETRHDGVLACRARVDQSGTESPSAHSAIFRLVLTLVVFVILILLPATPLVPLLLLVVVIVVVLIFSLVAMVCECKGEVGGHGRYRR